MNQSGDMPVVSEGTLKSTKDYPNPTRDVTVRALFTSPSGREWELEAFWDGGRTWRVRFAPDEEGAWTYRSSCSDSSNAGLHGQEGSFTVPSYDGDNPLYRHGPLRVSEDHRHLVHADGTPFFWLADTAWNGVLKAKPDDWRHYLTTRREQGFTTVQCVLTQWRAYNDEEAFTSKENIEIRPEFFRRLDAKVAAIAQEGLVPALVLLWALTPTDPGHYLLEEDAIRLARYMVARYGAYRPVWLLGGDGHYLAENIGRWKRIGRGVFDKPEEHVVTLHPSGMEWVGEAFREEPWYSFIAYQSGHGDDDKTLRWLVEGPPASEWKNEPLLPVINQEPAYEAHLAYQSRQPFDAHRVRRVLYWSLLVSPTAGVTYGHHGIWPWMEERGVPMDHPNSGDAPSWREALESEGVPSLRALAVLLQSLEWWKLCPAQELLMEQPGDEDAERFIAVARAEDGSFVMVYTPEGDAISLKTNGFSTASWFDPRTGKTLDASLDGFTFTPPDSSDWVLVLR